MALEATAATPDLTVQSVAVTVPLRLLTATRARPTAAAATTEDQPTEVWPTLMVETLPLILKLTSQPTEDTAAWAVSVAELTALDLTTIPTLTWVAT